MSPSGSGSISIAANFTCVADEPDFSQTPAASKRLAGAVD